MTPSHHSHGTDATRAALSVAWSAMHAAHPLVLCITNRVTPQRVADTLLAAGASPVMADNPAEVAQMAAIASAVYLNTGLHETQVASFEAAMAAMAGSGKTVVLDPVGAGATAYRTERINALRRGIAFSAIRGNASEIRALAGEAAGARGVDSADTADAALSAALALAVSDHTVVAVSGERDLITDGRQVARIGGGHEWLTRITGSGCALGALTAACIAATDPWIGALVAHAAFALATDRALPHSTGPGTLSIALLDALCALEPADFAHADITVTAVAGAMA